MRFVVRVDPILSSDNNLMLKDKAGYPLLKLPKKDTKDVSTSFSQKRRGRKTKSVGKRKRYRVKNRQWKRSRRLE